MYHTDPKLTAHCDCLLVYLLNLRSYFRYQDCAGTCIPSGPDLQAFASDLTKYKTAQAWITNGADAFRFNLDQLSMFHGGDIEVFRGESYTAKVEI